jgi:hypothetical protein
MTIQKLKVDGKGSKLNSKIREYFKRVFQMLILVRIKIISTLFVRKKVIVFLFCRVL